MTATLTRDPPSRSDLLDDILATRAIAHRWRWQADRSHHDPEWREQCLAEARAADRRAEGYAAQIGEGL